jgi:ferredoxin-NADP reductase
MSVSKIKVRLQGITYETAEVSLFKFVALEGVLPAASAGAHVDLHLPPAAVLSARHSIRQYSLVSPFCGPNHYVIGVKREPSGRGGSRWLHDQARVGDTLEISSPRNHFPLNETAPETMLLAGGIGITPIYAMFARLQELGRSVRLMYSCRSSDHAVFKDSLLGHPNVTMNYANGPDDGTIANFLASGSRDTEAYCCGPTAMIESCSDLAGGLSLRWHVERFSIAPPPRRTSEGENDRFTVRLARSGLSVEVENGQSILEALIAHGVDVPYSCEEGICGACETRVLQGAPLHRDAVRPGADHDRLRTMMICCSRSRTSVLELDL